MHAPVRWTAVVPFKGLTDAKQRLHATGPWRPVLAAAFATDVLGAVLGCEAVDEVVVVGGDGLPRALRVDPRVRRVDDVRGLDAAVRAGMGAARRDADVGLVVLPADLPCLRSRDVGQLLQAGRGGAVAVLADAEEDGTTAVVVPAGAAFAPRYGRGSYARHLDAGARPVVCGPRARRDVDTPAHLEQARLLGVGPATADVLRRLDAEPVPDARALG